MLEILGEESVLSKGVLQHSYSGSIEIVPQLVELSCYFSFSGNFLMKHKQKAKATFQTVPIERILVETDGPSQMLPEGLNEQPRSKERGIRRVRVVYHHVVLCILCLSFERNFLCFPHPFQSPEILAGNDLRSSNTHHVLFHQHSHELPHADTSQETPDDKAKP
jgi:hypothetical protein